MKNFVVKIILRYLRFLANLQLKKIKPFVIGVGGASGKTSLSNFIYLILSEKYKVKQGRGKNSETGIPLDILGLTMKNYNKRDWVKVMIFALINVLFDFRKFDIYIAEMGIDSPLEPKNMSYLLKIIKPKIGVLTNISFEHSVYFDPLTSEKDFSQRGENILQLTARQECLLLTSIDEDGTAILNIDDENIKKAKEEIRAKIITVSKENKKADFYIENIKNFVDEFLLQFNYEGKKYELKIENPLPEH